VKWVELSHVIRLFTRVTPSCSSW